MELSPTAYVILGMLRKSPKSGYEIKAMVDESTRFFWAASYGQIYPELRKLADAGLVEGTDAPRDGRRRTVYRITAAGRKELRSWLREPPRTYEMRDEGLLKLFFSDALKPSEAAAIVREMREHRLAVAERLREIEPKAIVGGGAPLLVLRGGIEHSEWVAGWCERIEQQLLSGAAEKEKVG
jgi:DNA-binding PadR family transcriptional regulator